MVSGFNFVLLYTCQSPHPLKKRRRHGGTGKQERKQDGTATTDQAAGTLPCPFVSRLQNTHSSLKTLHNDNEPLPRAPYAEKRFTKTRKCERKWSMSRVLSINELAGASIAKRLSPVK
jgi:hypothetical protein